MESRGTKSQRSSWVRIESSGGTALDWMYHEIGTKYSYQLKLRDTGTYGFLLPSKHIVPTGEEVVDAFLFFGTYLLSNKGVEIDDDHSTSETAGPKLNKPTASLILEESEERLQDFGVSQDLKR